MKLLKKITIKKIMSWGPCYEEHELREFAKNAGFKNSASPLEIAESNFIEDEDILWLLLRPEIIPKIELHELGCKFAERALKRERKEWREPHPGSLNAIKIKRQWMKGKVSAIELLAAESAARSARSARSAESATRASAIWASRSAESAARSDWTAAWLAAWSAAESARSARLAESAERKWQVKQSIKVLRRLLEDD